MKRKWIYVENYSVIRYKCGLTAGQKLRLRKNFTVKDWKGKATEKHEVGEMWVVLAGSRQDPDVVWLMRPDGERHTWSDDSDIYRYFEPWPRPKLKAPLRTRDFPK